MKIRPLSVYNHIKSGDLYFVLLTTNQTATQDNYIPTVAYISQLDECSYSRPLSEFLEKFEFVRPMNATETELLADIIMKSK